MIWGGLLTSWWITTWLCISDKLRILASISLWQIGFAPKCPIAEEMHFISLSWYKWYSTHGPSQIQFHGRTQSKSPDLTPVLASRRRMDQSSSHETACLPAVGCPWGRVRHGTCCIPPTSLGHKARFSPLQNKTPVLQIQGWVFRYLEFFYPIHIGQLNLKSFSTLLIQILSFLMRFILLSTPGEKMWRESLAWRKEIRIAETSWENVHSSMVLPWPFRGRKFYEDDEVCQSFCFCEEFL